MTRQTFPFLRIFMPRSKAEMMMILDPLMLKMLMILDPVRRKCLALTLTR